MSFENLSFKAVEEEYKNTQYKNFMLESNKIEGEVGLNPRDMDAIRYVIDGGLKTKKRLLHVHKILTEHLDVTWSGSYRTCAVYVGHESTPAPLTLDDKMSDFFKRLPTLSAWEAHNDYEIIHPFQDFNGRTGRLVWLAKAVNEYRDPFSLPFLHRYYYETLKNWRGTT
jgi:fido (protein-threonine AMPylation protein)